MTAQVQDGRANQKQRTRTAIIEAARGLAKSGTEVTMPAVAKAALVSEATAYRYFPHLPSLLREAVAGVWQTPAEALQPVADSEDPVERIGYATSYLLHQVQAYQGAVRAMIAAEITRPDSASVRPGQRFGLIDQALAPVEPELRAPESGRLRVTQAGTGDRGERRGVVHADRPVRPLAGGGDRPRRACRADDNRRGYHGRLPSRERQCEPGSSMRTRRSGSRPSSAAWELGRRSDD